MVAVAAIGCDSANPAEAVRIGEQGTAPVAGAMVSPAAVERLHALVEELRSVTLEALPEGRRTLTPEVRAAAVAGLPEFRRQLADPEEHPVAVLRLLQLMGEDARPALREVIRTDRGRSCHVSLLCIEAMNPGVVTLRKELDAAAECESPGVRTASLVLRLHFLGGPAEFLGHARKSACDTAPSTGELTSSVLYDELCKWRDAAGDASLELARVASSPEGAARDSHSRWACVGELGLGSPEAVLAVGEALVRRDLPVGVDSSVVASRAAQGCVRVQAISTLLESEDARSRLAALGVAEEFLRHVSSFLIPRIRELERGGSPVEADKASAILNRMR